MHNFPRMISSGHTGSFLFPFHKCALEVSCISLYDATTVAIQDRVRDKEALRTIDNLLQNKLCYYSELS